METTEKPALPPELERALDWDPEKPEVRSYQLTGLEWRDAGEETGGNYHTLSGHAAVFELLSLPLYDWWFGEFREKIAEGAFTNVLSRDPDVHLVYVHEMASAMARTRSKTLNLRQDEIGLNVHAKLEPDDLDVQRVAPKMRRGDVDQMSFAFSVAADEWEIKSEGDVEVVTRTIIEIGELYDVSIVPQGAYPQTDVGLRGREVRGLVEAMKRNGRLPEGAGATGERRAGVSPAGADPIAPELAPEGGDPDERAQRLVLMRKAVVATTTTLPTRS